MLYPNGHPFSDGLPENLDLLDTRVHKGKASLIIIDGQVGEGKTTLGVEIADYYNLKKSLPVIELTAQGPQYAKGGLEFIKKIGVCYQEKLPANLYDEAGDFNKRGSLTQFNAMLNRTFETFRAFKCVVILTVPDFSVIDQSLFDKGIPRLLLHLTGRTDKTGNYAGYSLYRMLLLRQKMGKLGQMKNYAYKLVQPNFRGHFLDLDPERSKQLDRVSTNYKLQILQKSEIKLDGLMTYPDMAVKLMKSISWVRNTANVLKVKPKRTIKSVKYFDPDALARITEHLDYVSENPKKMGRPKRE